MAEQGYKPEGRNFCGNKAEGYTQAELEKAFQQGQVIEARAFKCDGFCRLHVELGCMKGIITKEEALYSPSSEIKNIAVISRVGKPVCFKVKGFSRGEDGRPVAVLSRRAAQYEAAERYFSALRAGDVIPGRITHLEPFGAFVDIGCGVVSLVSIDNISVSRIRHPRDRFSQGDDIFCVVKAIQEEGTRISLSHKELLGTWEENAAEFCIGQTSAGRVRSIESYGIFVELAPNFAGLAELKDTVRVGQTACVYIKNILPERMKIKLVVVDSFDDDSPPPPLKYRITGGHIDRWRYSPDECNKIIETVF